MSKRTSTAQRAPSITQQKADFTAEGAPPPGKVATAAPVNAAEADSAPNLASAPGRRTVKAVKARRASSARYP